jgi:streptogramin lyase
VLPWGEDECVIWNTPMPSDTYQHGPRPTAWEGSKDENGCATPNPKLWIGWYDYATANTGKFHRLDGASGQILDSVDVPNWNTLDYGPYGGAVDGNGDFWASGWQLGPLIRIHGDTLDVDVYQFPVPPSGMQWAYGMALDQYGNPWIASSGAVATFDAATEQWSWVVLDHMSIRGVMVDRADRAWFAVDGAGPQAMQGCGLAVIDVANKTVNAPLLDLTGCIQPVGISIDVEGYVWVVDQGANQAFKVHPDTYQVALTATGLNAPYTYSDMTGAGLDLVTNPPQG